MTMLHSRVRAAPEPSADRSLRAPRRAGPPVVGATEALADHGARRRDRV
ncbi:hypothetical protein A7982_12168 [Minicystis rosea]|nr:hypothetical protein A7982_12168 [Minicystis rosea]